MSDAGLTVDTKIIAASNVKWKGIKIMNLLYEIPRLILSAIIKLIDIATKDWMGAATTLAVIAPFYFLFRFLLVHKWKVHFV